jgi:hypothetical protein
VLVDVFDGGLDEVEVEESGWGVKVDGLSDDDDDDADELIIVLNSSNISSCDLSFSEILADCPLSMYHQAHLSQSPHTVHSCMQSKRNNPPYLTTNDGSGILSGLFCLNDNVGFLYRIEGTSSLRNRLQCHPSRSWRCSQQCYPTTTEKPDAFHAPRAVVSVPHCKAHFDLFHPSRQGNAGWPLSQPREALSERLGLLADALDCLHGVLCGVCWMG